MDFYTFKDRSLILTALTHSSYANENKAEGIACNERLEFLGDSILGFVTASYLYTRFPELPEGNLTKIRAAVVCEGMLAKKARELNIPRLLRLGKGEEHTGGRNRTSIIADAMEAIIGAIYLDGGLEAAKKFILDMLINEIEDVYKSHSVLDTKTTLQEILQRNGSADIQYRIIGESGPSHAKCFKAEVLSGGKVLGIGEGKSKKGAEQAAAGEAIKNLT